MSGWIRRSALAWLAALLLAGPALAQKPAPGTARVRLVTSQGAILIELAMKRAPITAGNFMRYVDEKRFDNTYFYRAAKTRGTRDRGFVQGGIRHSARRMLPPIAHEPTSRTGLKHVDGTISMARTTPGSAMGDFFITVGDVLSMDARPGVAGGEGFAAFGQVVSGMDVVRRILQAPVVPNAGRGAMRGQMIAKPIMILTARRVR